MSAEVSVEVSLAQFDAALKEYARATGKGTVDVVRQQARFTVRELIKCTAPNTRGPTAGRIERDVKRVFRTPKALREEVEALIQKRTAAFLSTGHEAVYKVRWRNPRLGKRIEQLFEKHDAVGMEAVWRRVHGAPMNQYLVTNMIDGARLRAAKNPTTGSVPKGARGQSVIYAGNPANLQRFIRERQADVGVAKAGWVAAASALEAPVPSFVRKQTKKFGRVAADLSATAIAPFVLIVNSSTPAIAQDAAYQIVQKAIAERVGAMNKQLRYLHEREARKFNS